MCPRALLSFSALRAELIGWVRGSGGKGREGRTEDDGGVGLFEACQVPEVGRLAELVACEESAREPTARTHTMPWSLTRSLGTIWRSRWICFGMKNVKAHLRS